jgi:hypothetical protein
MEAIKSNSFLVKTRPPISMILLVIINCLFLFESISNWVWIIYLLPLNVIFYIQFCRFCCIITMTQEFIKVRYFNPVIKSITIPIKDIKAIDYEKAFYDFFSRKTIGGTLFLPQYCFDRLIVRFKDTKGSIIYVNVNVLMFDFDRVLKCAIKLKLLDKL